MDDGLRERGAQAARRPQREVSVDAQRRGVDFRRRDAEGDRSESDHRQQVDRHREPAEGAGRGRLEGLCRSAGRGGREAAAARDDDRVSQSRDRVAAGRRQTSARWTSWPPTRRRTSCCSSTAGTCVEAGADPVAWINANPGRIRSLHLKDWGKGEGRGYAVAFGEGDVPWKALLRRGRSQGRRRVLFDRTGSRARQAPRCKWRRSAWTITRSCDREVGVKGAVEVRSEVRLKFGVKCA